MQFQLTNQDAFPVVKIHCIRHWPPNTVATNGNAGCWWMPRGYLAPSTAAHPPIHTRTHTHTHTSTHTYTHIHTHIHTHTHPNSQHHTADYFCTFCERWNGTVDQSAMNAARSPWRFTGTARPLPPTAIKPEQSITILARPACGAMPVPLLRR